MKILYALTLITFVIFSYGFIDPNFPYQPLPQYFDYLHRERLIAAAIYIGLLCLAFFTYFRVLRKLLLKDVWKYIAITLCIAIFAYPAFSADIFNYITTARVLYHYGENPYVVMPVEISSEPSLSYLHAGNKVALYGWSWLVLTAIPHYLGFGQVLVTLLFMKLTTVVFYLWLVRQIESITKRSSYAVALFALNPLVVIETFMSGHQDVVMMALAFYALSLIEKRRFFLGAIFLTLSIFIKGATIALLPVVLLYVSRRLKNLWYWSFISMLIVFFLSPIREEMYPWYFIWVLPFVSLLPSQSLWVSLSLAATFGLELRIVPYLYTWRWDGLVPLIKTIVTVTPPALSAIWYGTRTKN